MENELSSLDQKLSLFETGFPPDTAITDVLDAYPDGLWAALEAVLADEPTQQLSVVIDGLDKVKHQKDEFIKRIDEFVIHLQEGISRFKALLTSEPQSLIRETFNRLQHIEYDERKGLTPLYTLALN